ncbi:hypothetical protein [Streptomyces sp. YS-3]|uniref:hypothetical protein n=1 Tax=Streptomyces sp. YS-3 TaxID=3381352 RepID=UPI003862B116
MRFTYRSGLGAAVAVAGVAAALTPLSTATAAPGPAATTAHSSVAAASWHHLWGPAQISAGYFNSHSRWVSGTFVPDTDKTGINFNCYNSGDGGKARVRLYNVETRKYIPVTGNTGYQYCNKAGNNWFGVYSKGGYRIGQGLRVVIDESGKKHTVNVKAYDYHR